MGEHGFGEEGSLAKATCPKTVELPEPANGVA